MSVSAFTRCQCPTAQLLASDPSAVATGSDTCSRGPSPPLFCGDVTLGNALCRMKEGISHLFVNLFVEEADSQRARLSDFREKFGMTGRQPIPRQKAAMAVRIHSDGGTPRRPASCCRAITSLIGSRKLSF
jgi:hypothetical protein